MDYWHRRQSTHSYQYEHNYIWIGHALILLKFQTENIMKKICSETGVKWYFEADCVKVNSHMLLDDAAIGRSGFKVNSYSVLNEHVLIYILIVKTTIYIFLLCTVKIISIIHLLVFYSICSWYNRCIFHLRSALISSFVYAWYDSFVV